VHEPPIVAAIGGTLLTDTLALALLAIVVHVSGAEESSPAAWVALLLLALLVVTSLLVVPRVSRVFLDADVSREEKGLFVLVVLLVLASAAEIVGTEDILGAFLAGLCLNTLIKRRTKLHEQIAFVGRMLFIPFFFVETGMRVELEVLARDPSVWGLAGVLLLVVVTGKGMAALVSGSIFGYSAAERGAILGLTLPQAAATLAVTVTGARVGLLDELVVDSIIIVILLTSLFGPILTSRTGERIRRLREEAGP
jgi:Kef-type K+ transport system membrane component KefB